MTKDEDKFSKEILGAAIEVHSCLGPELLESTFDIFKVVRFKIRDID